MYADCALLRLPVCIGRIQSPQKPVVFTGVFLNIFIIDLKYKYGFAPHVPSFDDLIAERTHTHLFIHCMHLP